MLTLLPAFFCLLSHSSVPPEGAPGSLAFRRHPRGSLVPPRRLRLICKRIFALINGFKKDKELERRGREHGPEERGTRARPKTGGTRKSFEFILIILTNRPRNEGLTNYLLEYDCAEFLTRDRPISARVFGDRYHWLMDSPVIHESPTSISRIATRGKKLTARQRMTKRRKRGTAFPTGSLINHFVSDADAKESDAR